MCATCVQCRAIVSARGRAVDWVLRCVTPFATFDAHWRATDRTTTPHVGIGNDEREQRAVRRNRDLCIVRPLCSSLRLADWQTGALLLHRGITSSSSSGSSVRRATCSDDHRSAVSGADLCDPSLRSECRARLPARLTQRPSPRRHGQPSRRVSGRCGRGCLLRIRARIFESLR